MKKMIVDHQTQPMTANNIKYDTNQKSTLANYYSSSSAVPSASPTTAWTKIIYLYPVIESKDKNNHSR